MGAVRSTGTGCTTGTGTSTVSTTGTGAAQPISNSAADRLRAPSSAFLIGEVDIVTGLPFGLHSPVQGFNSFVQCCRGRFLGLSVQRLALDFSPEAFGQVQRGLSIVFGGLPCCRFTGSGFSNLLAFALDGLVLDADNSH